MRPVTFIRKRHNRAVEKSDRGGGVFVPDGARGLVRPVYSYGPEGSKTLDPIFSCPKGIIPAFVWSLLDIWFASRTMGALPKAGGVLDQPLSILRSFPIFETEHRLMETRRQGSTVMAAFAMLGHGRTA